MTEDEAKKKWCFQLPRMDLEIGTCCVGSGCMAWRWQFRCGENPDNPAEAISLPPIEGYCGLAGRPA